MAIKDNKLHHRTQHKICDDDSIYNVIKSASKMITKHLYLIKIITEKNGANLSSYFDKYPRLELPN